MTDYWLSWYTDAPVTTFEMHSPWWVSGYSGDGMIDILVALVRAEDEDAAFAQVLASYDDPPAYFDRRFIEPLGDVQPFGDMWSTRWPRSQWMEWTPMSTCRCPQHEPTTVAETAPEEGP